MLSAPESLTDNQIVPANTTPFSPQALAENHSGHLTDDQARRFQFMVIARRKGTRSLALPVGAIGALLLLLNGPATTAVKRHLAGWGFVAAVAVLLAAPAFDPLAADVRDGRVETIEGAIGKRWAQSRGSAALTRYYLIVAGRQLRTYRSAYDAAPDAGYVRAYYLPRTRRLVNLERLPNPPLPAGSDLARNWLGRLARGLFNRDPVASAEARASVAALIDAGQSINDRSDATSGPAAAGLVRSALVGRWTHPFVTITLADNGTATVATIAGASRAGHWSVDAQGRLLTDVSGSMQPTDAALDGDRLTIHLKDQRLTFTRVAGA